MSISALGICTVGRLNKERSKCFLFVRLSYPCWVDSRTTIQQWATRRLRHITDRSKIPSDFRSSKDHRRNVREEGHNTTTTRAFATAAITRQRCRQRSKTTRLWHRQPADKKDSTDIGRTRKRARARVRTRARARARAQSKSKSTDRDRGQERGADSQARAVLLQDRHRKQPGAQTGDRTRTRTGSRAGTAETNNGTDKEHRTTGKGSTGNSTDS